MTQVQDPALSLVEPHATGLSPLIQPLQTPLQSLRVLKQINTPLKLGVICKLTEGVLDPLTQIINKVINRTSPTTEPWGTPLVTGHQPDVTPFTTTL